MNKFLITLSIFLTVILGVMAWDSVLGYKISKLNEKIRETNSIVINTEERRQTVYLTELTYCEVSNINKVVKKVQIYQTAIDKQIQQIKRYRSEIMELEHQRRWYLRIFKNKETYETKIFKKV